MRLPRAAIVFVTAVVVASPAPCAAQKPVSAFSQPTALIDSLVRRKTHGRQNSIVNLSTGSDHAHRTVNERKEDAVRRTIALFITLASMPAAAHAQAAATSFAELASLLKAGETVSVTNNGGKTIKGKVQQVSDSILVLRSGLGDVTVASPDVQRIARSRHTVRNGALLGLAVGFVAGAAWASSQPCDWVCFSSSGGVLVFGGLAGAIGMGVGAGLGASFRGEYVVFERTATGRAQAAITPLPRRGAGLAVKISW